MINRNYLILLSSLFPLFLIFPSKELYNKKLNTYKIILFITIGGTYFHIIQKINERFFKNDNNITFYNIYAIIICSIAQIITILVIDKSLKLDLSNNNKILLKIAKYLILLNLIYRLISLTIHGFDTSVNSLETNILWKYKENQEYKKNCPFSNCSVKTIIIGLIILVLLYYLY